jgi:hypothetical protein
MKHELHRSVRWGVCRRTDFMRNSRLARAVFSQQNRGVERIRDYRFGHVIIDGEAHARDVIVLPSRVVANWWRREGHSLVLDDLDDVIAELPGTLIVGSGASSQMRPAPKTLQALRDRGIEVEVLSTPETVRRFAECDPEQAAATLHLTC